MRYRAIFTMGIALAGCGAPTSPPTTSQAGKKADVIVTLDGVHHECVVALSNEQHGSSIVCGDLIPFLKDELRLAAGATYDLRTTPEVSDGELTSVKEHLKNAGYRLVGDR